MRVIALDIGEKRIGVAVGDTTTCISSPLCVMDAHEILDNSKKWRLLLQDNEAELIVCGLPRTLSGGRGKQAARIEQLAHQIAECCSLPLEFSDERLSSSEAKRILREQGLSEREMRGKIDSIAASLFLETWLESHRNEGVSY